MVTVFKTQSQPLFIKVFSGVHDQDLASKLGQAHARTVDQHAHY